MSTPNDGSSSARKQPTPTLGEALRGLAAMGVIASPSRPAMLVETVLAGYPVWYRVEHGLGLVGEPVVGDPATDGCLLALLQEAHQDCTIYVRYDPWRPEGFPHWTAVCGPRGDGDTIGQAIAEALIAKYRERIVKSKS